MTRRIKELTELTLQGKMYVDTVNTDFDDNDNMLSENERDIKHLCMYILNQEPKITEYSMLTGNFLFTDSIVGDAEGHISTKKALEKYCLNLQESLSIVEWQSATACYEMVLENGIVGIINDINFYLDVYMDEPEKMDLLSSLRVVVTAFTEWTEKCSKRAKELIQATKSKKTKKRLEKLAEALKHSPKYAPRTFYEAIISIYICFSIDSKGLGTLDRYLTPFYKNDIEKGTLTRKEAKEYLQELFLMIQACTCVDSKSSIPSETSCFSIGGYLPNQDDSFNDVSRLIVEALIELPTCFPKITLRLTEKTPKDVLRYMMKMERRDKYNRITLTSEKSE